MLRVLPYLRGGWLSAILVLWALSFGAACAPPPAVTPPAPARQPAQATEELETWEAVYIEKAKVGHVHTRTERVVEEGRELQRTSSQMLVTMERFGQSTTQDVSVTSVENPNGEVLRFEWRLRSGAAEMIVRGNAVENKMAMTIETLGKSQRSSLDWDKSWGGFFAVERSLREKPLAAGETRELRALYSDFPLPSVATIRLEALDQESTELLETSRELLKIKQTIELEGGNKIESFAWTDKQGEALKSQLVSGLPHTAFRTTKEVALGKSNAKFDLGITTTVPIAQVIRNAHQTKRVVYRAKIKDGTAKDAFVAGPTQSIMVIDSNTVELTVRAIRPDEPATLETPDQPPTDDDLAPSNLIQSDDERVVALAASAAGEERDAWKLAVALERHVKTSMKSTNFSQAFATAAETAKSLEGDCTEHAMLLAAVCRARKIPSRVAVGLVYDGKGGFAFHMWTEVWIADRWIGLDATRGSGGIGGAHLKLAHSNLKVSSITTAFLPVLKVLGRLELEVVEVE